MRSAPYWAMATRSTSLAMKEPMPAMTQSPFGQAKRTDQRLSVPGENLVSKPVSGQAGNFYRPRRGFAGLQARRQALQDDSQPSSAQAQEPKQSGRRESAQQAQPQ